MDQARTIDFLKMHGLGNDFVIVDARARPDPITPEFARRIGDRHFGVGFDQLAVILPGDEAADAEIVFWNADGTRAGACGNASRCVARLLMEESGRDAVTLRTERGLLPARRAGAHYSVNMGPPVLDWREIPLARPVEDLANLPIEGQPGAVGMGNPHCVFLVADAEAVDLARLGPEFERHPLFPERTNVEFVEVRDRETLRMRVWERGAGVTLACGSGACAAAVVAHLKGVSERRVTLILDGGALEVDWREDGVWMTGPAEKVFEGRLAGEFLA